MRAGKTPNPADPANRSLNSDFVILITFLCSWRHRPIPANFGQSTPKGKNPVTWPAFPKRLQSALKALCCLAGSGQEMQSQAIAAQIAVPEAETAKILQLLVWGGFVNSRRGTKGGFHLAIEPSQIEAGELWEVLQTMLPGLREQRLASLLYHCGLKPREIVRFCPQEWSDVQEIYHLRHSILERLMHNVDQLRWRLNA